MSVHAFASPHAVVVSLEAARVLRFTPSERSGSTMSWFTSSLTSGPASGAPEVRGGSDAVSGESSSPDPPLDSGEGVLPPWAGEPTTTSWTFLPWLWDTLTSRASPISGAVSIAEDMRGECRRARAVEIWSETPLRVKLP